MLGGPDAVSSDYYLNRSFNTQNKYYLTYTIHKHMYMRYAFDTRHDHIITELLWYLLIIS